MLGASVQAPRGRNAQGGAPGRECRARGGAGAAMKELLRSNDLVLISAVEALLDAAGIGHLVADAHISALEGSIGILPRRLLVPDDDARQARRLLVDAGFGDTLVAGDP